MAAASPLQTPPVSTNVSLAQPTALAELLVGNADPWTWDVDKVVAHICDPNNAEILTVKAQNRPNFVSLEQALRENDIDGAALLTEVNNDTMRSYLGVKSLGHCATIKRMIKYLQRTSQGYLEELRRNAAVELPEIQVTSHASVSVADSLTHSMAGHVHGTLPAAFRTQEWLRSSQSTPKSTGNFEGNATIAPNNHVDTASASCIASRHEGRARRVSGNSATYTYQSVEGNFAHVPSETSVPKPFPDETPGRASETYFVDAQGRKRRRLNLTTEARKDFPEEPTVTFRDCRAHESQYPQSTDNETSHPEKNLLEAATQIATETPPRISAVQSDLDNPSSIPYDPHGRKRCTPLNLQGHLPEHDANDSITSRKFTAANGTEFSKGKRREKDEYLGHRALLIDDMIYGGTPLNGLIAEESPASSSSADYQILSQERDPFGISHGYGKRTFASKRVQHFLQISPIEHFNKRGERVWDMIPYPDRLGRKHHELSMTRLTYARGDIKVQRLVRSHPTPTDNPKTIYGDEHNIFNLPYWETNSGGAPDWDMLAKWDRLNDADRVLPVYGDSGSENEFSLDLMHEIEAEQGHKVERPKAVPIGEALNIMEVNRTIDEAIGAYIAQWERKHEPKSGRKSWKIWQRSRKEKTVKNQIQLTQEKIQYLSIRLEQQRREVCREAWRKRLDVFRSCRNMQPTVDDREDARWTIAVLQQKESPLRPPRPGTKRETATAQGLEKLLAIDEVDLEDEALSSRSDPGSHDDLADFVVSDEDEHIKLRQTTLTDDAADDEEGENLVTLSHPQSEKSLTTHLVRNPRAHLLSPQANSTDIIDLTQYSDPLEVLSEEPIPVPAPPTPPLLLGSDSDDPFKRSSAVMYKKPPVVSNVIELSSDTDAAQSSSNLSRALPPIEDTIAISKLDPSMLAERQDRKRLLVHHIHRTPRAIREQMMKTRDHSVGDMWHIVRKALSGMKGGSHKLRGYNPLESNALMRIASLYVSWTIPVAISEQGIALRHIDDTLEEERGFEDFHECMLYCFNFYDPLTQRSVDTKLEGEATPGSRKRRKRRIAEDEDYEEESEEMQSTPSRKRKYAVPESQETLDIRALAQQRMQVREQRREMMQYRMTQMKINEGDAAKVLVNIGKEDHQKDIYLNPSTGKLIQPHQQEGVRFLWRELTTDHKQLQGCLLAQTMGLGKTMQVISTLVTIAEASKSSDQNIRDQVPQELQHSRTLILCPAALAENWYEEFLMWAPLPLSDNIGDIRKVTAAIRPQERSVKIKAWRDEGGVLILGYDGFRNFVKNRDDSSKPSADLAKILLDAPTIVVADEAHIFKNFSSSVSKAVNNIKCKSRIALTGSPLSNNLNEYYAIVDWIAPGYLGNFVEFKANFTEPIEAGLYLDSTQAEYRNSRKRLQALQTDLEPKVHRADASILKARLHGKIEFVIRVALTDFQDRIYHHFVGSTYGDSDNHKDVEKETATLWAWINLLKLLCNHPYCFMQGLQHSQAVKNNATSVKGNARKKPMTRIKSINETLSTTEDDTDPMHRLPVKSALSSKMVERQLTFLRSLQPSFEDDKLSNKIRVLYNILRLSQTIGDKCLVFTHSILTLDYVERLIQSLKITYCRIDGTTTQVSQRQKICKDFNTGPINVCIISTKAGGQGLNMFGANRVVIMDSNFNPMWEEQAIGRAYRIGQGKPVYVYHLIVGGTFEDRLHEQAIFKQQLATRVVDKKNPNRYAERGVGQYLHPPKPVEQKDLRPLQGKDTYVLDRILSDHIISSRILSIDLTETYHQEDPLQLTPEETQEAFEMQRQQQLRRTDPAAHRKALHKSTAMPDGPYNREPVTPVPSPAVALTPAFATMSHPSYQSMLHPSSEEVGPIVADTTNLGIPGDAVVTRGWRQSDPRNPTHIRVSQGLLNAHQSPYLRSEALTNSFSQAFDFLNIPDADAESRKFWIPGFRVQYFSQLRSRLLQIFESGDGSDYEVCGYATNVLMHCVCAKAVNQMHCLALYQNVMNYLTPNPGFVHILYEDLEKSRRFYQGLASAEEVDTPVLRLVASSDLAKAFGAESASANRLSSGDVPPSGHAPMLLCDITGSNVITMPPQNDESLPRSNEVSGGGEVLGEVDLPFITKDEIDMAHGNTGEGEVLGEAVSPLCNGNEVGKEHGHSAVNAN